MRQSWDTIALIWKTKKTVYFRDEDKIQMLMRIDVRRQIIMSRKKSGCPP